MLFRIKSLSVVLCYFSFVAASWAGGPLTVAGSDGNTPLTYPNGGSNVVVNYDLGTLGSRYTNAQADAIVDSAIGLWNNVSTSTINIVKGSDLPTDVTSSNYNTYIGGSSYTDGLNPVVYDTDGSIIDSMMGSGAKNSILGFAGSVYYTNSNDFLEGRAVINGYYPDANPSFSDDKLIVVLAHELGHFIGMDHTQLDNTQGLSGSNYPLMYPQAYRDFATLHDDDVSAVSALYPGNNISDNFGTVTGTFLDASNNPIKGANIWFKETTTGKVYSIVSDYKKQNTGYFSILLPAGTYNLNAESISTSFTGGSSVGPYSESLSDASFQSPHPITPVSFGAPDDLTIVVGCAMDITFKLDGSGSINSDNCEADTAVGTLTISQTVYTVDESVGNATITVTRSDSTSGAITLDYATSDVTATAGSDYTAASGTLSWADGESGDKTFTIAITDDSTQETNERLSITLSNNTSGTTLLHSSAELYITDNEASVRFADAYIEASEGDGTATISIERVGSTSGAISVDYATVAGGTASTTSDYTATSGTLSWADGVGGAKSFTITLTDDSSFESLEYVNLQLSNAVGTSIVNANNQLYITDDDSSVRVDAIEYGANESDGTVTITVLRKGSTSGAISVDYATIAGGTATAGSDYTATSGTLNWSDGESGAKTFSVTIIDDTDIESHETINVQLSNGVNTGISQADTTIYIYDNEAFLKFSAPEFSVTEGTASVTISVNRVGGTAGAVTVDYATSNNTATAGSDYLAASGTLSWADGEGGSKSFSITIIDDASSENPESVTITLSNASGANIDTATTSLFIYDNDTFLKFSNFYYEVNEGVGTLSVSVNRVGNASGTASVDYTTTANTASAGSDYTATSGTLSWADGESGSKSFNVTIIDDSDVEGFEVLFVDLSNASGASIIESSVPIIIYDNESLFRFHSTYVYATEGTPTMTVSVLRYGDISGAASVDYATAAGGTATAGSDYTATSGTLSWSAGEGGVKTFTISVTDDADIESYETVNVELSNASGGTIQTSNMLTYIYDNESIIRYRYDYMFGYEGDVTITVTVMRYGHITNSASIDYTTTAAGTAVAGSDFTATSGTLSWAAGEGGTKTFTVSITDDGSQESYETIGLTLSNPVNSTLYSANNVIYLYDND